MQTSSPTCLLKQGELEQVTQECIQLGFGYLHRYKLHNLSGHPTTLFDPSLSKDFSCLQIEFPENGLFYCCG